MEQNKRTLSQNAALHLWLEKVSQAFNEAGIDRKVTITLKADVPNSAETMKEVIWRPIQYAQTGKHSTTELTTKEYSEVWETVNRFIGENFGIHVPIQSYEELLMERKNND